MRLFKLLPGVALLLLNACLETEPPPEPVDLLLINARVIDGTGEVYDGATLAINGERIESIVRGPGPFENKVVFGDFPVYLWKPHPGGSFFFRGQ